LDLPTSPFWHHFCGLSHSPSAFGLNAGLDQPQLLPPVVPSGIPAGLHGEALARGRCPRAAWRWKPGVHGK